MATGQSRLVPYIITIIISVLLSYGVVKFSGGGGGGGQATGESTLDRILRTKTLREGICTGQVPYCFRDAQGNQVGVEPDMGREMAKALDVKLEIVETADPNRIPFVNAGKIDFAFGTITLARAKAVSYGGLWVVDATAGAVLSDSGVTDYSQLNSGKTLAAIRGDTGDIYMTKAFPNAKFLRVEDSATLEQTLLKKQADAIFHDFSSLNLWKADHPEIMVLKAVDREPSGLMVKLGDQTWINWVGWFLNDYYGSGVSTCGCGKDVLKKYLKADPLPLLFNY
jgi:polar amino acid transport system substrate-binding protein